MAYGSHNALCQQFLMYKDITHHNCGLIIVAQEKQWIQICKENVFSFVFLTKYGFKLCKSDSISDCMLYKKKTQLSWEFIYFSS